MNNIAAHIKPRLKFNPDKIQEFTGRYDFRSSDSEIIRLQKNILGRGYLTKGDLKAVAYWKAPRSSKNVDKNPEQYVEEITGFTLKTSSERARIETLTVLDGVGWPTASVILHLFHTDPYPIMDYRALWTVTLEVPKQYSFDFWWEYVRYCRNIAQEANVDMRTLDKALWQYSKENQNS